MNEQLIMNGLKTNTKDAYWRKQCLEKLLLSTLSIESPASKNVFSVISFLKPTLQHLLCNVSIQPHFDYACSVWYPNITKNIKHRIQTTQNNCILFCLQLGNLKHISREEFECLKWLAMTYKFTQCVNSIVFKYFNEHCPNYLSKVSNVTAERNIQLIGSFQPLKYPFRKTNSGQFAFSYIGRTFWNKTPETFNCTNNLNVFNLNLKKHFLNELKDHSVWNCFHFQL